MAGQVSLPIAFQIQTPASIPAGSYPIRIYGALTHSPEGESRRVVEAHTTMTMGPLLFAFLLFQRQFVQSFMRAGIR